MSPPTDRDVLLVVDDEEDIRNLVAQIAESMAEGHDVLRAESADAAERMMVERNVVAVLTDIRMPGRSGIDLVRQIQAANPGTRCAVMTGFIDPVVDGTNLDDLGVAAVLRKPFEFEDCQRVIATLVGA